MLDNLSIDDLEILADYEEEIERSGNFELVFPKPLTVGLYKKYFLNLRRNNELLWQIGRAHV